MVVKELMVGDWVYVDYKAAYIKAINETGIICHIEEYDNIDNVYTTIFEPIPLTPEILKKNEFKLLIEDEKYKTLCLNKPYINCTFVKEFKDWMITVGAAGSVKKRFVEASKVQFVHEMQHLLRLCKYELDLKL